MHGVVFGLFFLLTSLVLNAGAVYAQPSQITPSHVYQVTEQARQELMLILEQEDKRVFSDVQKPEKRYPRHVWQKAREVLVKLGKLQKKVELPSVDVPALNTAVVLPSDVKLLADDILSGARQLRQHYNIAAPEAKVPFEKGKKPTDVYYKMAQVSAILDTLLNSVVTPSDVFRAVRTVREKLQDLHQATGAHTVKPLPSNTVTGKRPRDVFFLALSLQEKLVQLEKRPGYMIQGGVAQASPRGGRITPADVLDLMNIILADVNELARSVHVRQAMVLAPYVAGKTPTDVYLEVQKAIALVEAIE